jgi:PAS domain S-box-containing protein
MTPANNLTANNKLMRIASEIQMSTQRTANSRGASGPWRNRFQAPPRASHRRHRAKFEFAVQYRALFENNALPMWVIDRKSLGFLAANRAAVRHYGYSKAEFKRMTVLDLHPAEERSRLRKSLSRGWEPTHASYLSRHLTKNGKLIEVEVCAEPLTLYGRPIRLATALNITKRIEAESRAKSLAKFPDENPNPALRVSRDGMVIYHNKPSALLLRAWSCGKDRRLSGKWLRTVRTTYDSGLPRQEEFECGEQIFSLTFAPVREFGYVNIYGLDITERKRLEKAVLETGEQERRRIGQDLHDHLNQQLAGIAYLNDVLGKRLARQGLAETADAARIRDLLDQTIRDTRSLAQGLFPVKLETNGLMTALLEFARTVRETYKIGCRFESGYPVLLQNNATATHLFRIAQEAVRNAIQHGNASSIVMYLRRKKGAVHLTVKSNGRDFPGKLPRNGGMGIEIMKHRAHASGGDLEIRRAPRGGTIVACHLARQIA